MKMKTCACSDYVLEWKQNWRLCNGPVTVYRVHPLHYVNSMGVVGRWCRPAHKMCRAASPQGGNMFPQYFTVTTIHVKRLTYIWGTSLLEVRY